MNTKHITLVVAAGAGPVTALAHGGLEQAPAWLLAAHGLAHWLSQNPLPVALLALAMLAFARLWSRPPQRGAR